MCGNGARCAARFAVIRGIAGGRMRFETEAGLIAAWVDGAQVRVKLTDPGRAHAGAAAGAIRCRVAYRHRQHRSSPCGRAGGRPRGRRRRVGRPGDPAAPGLRPGRNQRQFSSASLRTGAWPSAPMNAGWRTRPSPAAPGPPPGRWWLRPRWVSARRCSLRTRSGEVLTVHFSRRDGRFCDIFQEGPARLVFAGRLHEEAWR
jgi:diaminopimelate epimerase